MAQIAIKEGYCGQRSKTEQLQIELMVGVNMNPGR